MYISIDEKILVKRHYVTVIVDFDALQNKWDGIVMIIIGTWLGTIY